MDLSKVDPAPIRFLLNGEALEVEGVAPTTSVLTFLRERQRCTGTKEGCAEGDCGACTVVVGELDGEELHLKTVNACIQFLPTLDGKALFTVESLRQQNGSLHPVQQALVDCHGSQCGFCTPGFAMSLWNLYVEHQRRGSRPDRKALRNELTGNLCRCTGYRPILDAGEQMFRLPKAVFPRAKIKERLEAVRREGVLVYQHGGTRFHSPRTLAQLTRLKADNPSATLLAGGTDIGLWVNKQFRELGDIIHVGDVGSLREIESQNDALRIGASVSLSDAYEALEALYPQVREMWERFASPPIRNAGTLGGNVANGSPIGDSMPWLIAVGTRVVLRNTERARTLALEDLYVDYMEKSMHPDEIVEAVEVPFPGKNQRFRTYKLSKRFDSDISAVCAAFAIELTADRVVRARIAFGGMAATPKRATHCEMALSGRPWSEPTVRDAMAALARDYRPLTDMRASSEYRTRTAANLLYRFYLETRPENPLPAEAVSVFAAA